MNREELLKNAKPILFNTEMVQAILEGRKTVTRRVVKYYSRTPTKDGKDKFYKINENLNGTNPNRLYAGFYNNNDIFYIDGEKHIDALYYPLYFKVGDILYVRETWAKIDDLPYDNYVYRTDYGTTEDDSFPPSMYKWKPSIHMPKEAARIFLKVTDVRVERLQEITPKDAWEEGCRIGNSFPWEIHIPELQQQCRDIFFKSLWDGLNAKRGYGWDTNPWVWVIEFERVEVENE